MGPPNTPSIAQLYTFITCAAVVKNDILLSQPSNHPFDEPPNVLPPAIATLLGRICGLPRSVVTDCWENTKETIWGHSKLAAPTALREEMFREHGHNLGFRM